MKAPECLQYFSHYKCTGIFSDAQVQLPLQSVVEYRTQSKILWFQLIDLIKNEGTSAIKQDYTSNLKSLKGS